MKELISFSFTAGLDMEELKVVLIRKATPTLLLSGEFFLHSRENREQKHPQKLLDGSEADIIATEP